MPRVRRRNPGDPLSIKAREWNAIADLVNREAIPVDVLAGPALARLPAGVVYVRNSSGADADRFEPLEITGTLADHDSEGFLARAAFVAGSPGETDLPPGQWVLTLESIPDGEIGRAAILGVFPVLATISSTAHRFLRVVDGQATLQSCSSGQVPILAPPPATGLVGLAISLAPAAEPMEIWARLGEATPIVGETWRWSYAWEEVVIDGTSSTTAGATRNSASDGPAYNSTEYYNDANNLGSGLDPDNLIGTFEPVPLGTGVYRLRRQTGGGAWTIVGAIQPDGECPA